VTRFPILAAAAILAVTYAAAAQAPARPVRPEALLDRLPESLNELILLGDAALPAVNTALAGAEADRKARLLLARAALQNQQGDAAAAREALSLIPAGSDKAVAARALYESALAAEQLGESDAARSLYEKAAAGDVATASAAALLRLAMLDRFAGKPESARKRLAAVAASSPARRAADDASAALERFVEAGRTAPTGAVPGGHWRLRVADTFAAPKVTFPGYEQFFRNGWMQIYSREDGFNRFAVGMFSGGGTVESEHMIAEFRVKLRQVVDPGGRWLSGFVVRGEPGKRTGVVVQSSEERTLRIEYPAGSETFDPPVYRSRGPNTFRVVALHARVEIHVNGLPAVVVLDPEFKKGRLEFLAAGCVTDYDHYSVLVPSPAPGSPEKARDLNAAALEAAGNGDFAGALARLEQLVPLTEPDCESRAYLYRLLREHGKEPHRALLNKLWPAQVAPDHWVAADQARMALAMRWAEEPVRGLFAEAARAFGAGRTADSIRLLTDVLGKAPNNTAALDARAEAYRVAGKFEEAIADCEAVIKADERSLMPLMRLVTIARRLGKADQEMKAIQRMLRSFPNFPGGAEMLEDAKKRANPNRGPVQAA
jgi:tetratricopeptide (TPR) repeat protein